MKPLNLTGKTFGRLTVLRRGKNYQGHTAFLCRCKCGKEKTIASFSLIRGATRSCGCLRDEHTSKLAKSGKLNHRWKGGSRIDGKGYVKINCPSHPNAVSHGYVLEHIKVMSEHLGRKIDTEKETIHHKNGVRDDNRLENLELWTTYHPCGQRVDDLVKFAMETLEKYSDRAQTLILEERSAS